MTIHAHKLTLLAAAAGVLINRALLALGLRRRVDGWRQAAGLLLRGECSTFVLSAFGLNVWSDAKAQTPRTLADTRAHAAERLTKFLIAEAACHIAIEHGVTQDRARGINGPSFTLAFEPWIQGPARFVSPKDWRGQRASTVSGNAGVLLNIVIRVDDTGSADVWVRINHVGADGVPMQEMLTRLEADWGGSAVFPSPETFAPFSQPRTLIDRPDLSEIQAFIDFTPLVKWRKRENARLAEPMTLTAAMLWCLARHSAFSDVPIGTTVEVAAVEGLERAVGVIVVQPGDYAGHSDGLSRYVRDFNRQMDLTRRRASGSCRTLDAAAFISPTRARALLRHALDNTPRAFGHLALTMLKDARIFGAPIGETGHARGFIAVGSVALPGPDGSRVGCVTIKGPTEVVSAYPKLIRQAIELCERDEAAARG